VGDDILLCFPGSCVRLSRKVPAVVILTLSLFWDRTIWWQFVIPWTTTVTTLLLSIGIYAAWLAQRAIKDPTSKQPSWVWTPCVSCLLALVVAARPVDIIPAAALWFGYVVLRGRVRKASLQRISLGAEVSISCVGAAVGPLFLFGFNLFVYGNAFGGYIQNTLNNGYFPSAFLTRFICCIIADLSDMHFKRNRKNLRERQNYRAVS
jgi:hypothetical protein